MITGITLVEKIKAVRFSKTDTQLPCMEDCEGGRMDISVNHEERGHQIQNFINWKSEDSKYIDLWAKMRKL